MSEHANHVSGAVHAYGEAGFWSRADMSGGPEACWPWTGALNAKGYGRRNHRGRLRLAHGVAFELSGREVPDGFTIDHLCRNRSCVNPGHLEAVPHRVNLLRGNTVAARSAAATHCPSGHPYDVENTARRRGERICRECERIRNAKVYQPRGRTRRRRRKLTHQEKAAICELIDAGLSHSQIAPRFNVAIGTVSRVRNARTP